MSQTQKWYILRSAEKKNIKKTYFPLMTTFYKFPLKIDTSCPEKILKPIMETWNANDVIVYVGFIYSRIK